jgi:hypothetical protein
MAGSDPQGIPLGEINEALFIPNEPNECWTGGFTKGNPELHRRVRLHYCFVQVFNGLDEMRMPEDEIHVVGLFDANHG